MKSNITDNESAKLVNSHGVIQGYNGIAAVDGHHQIVVDAQAFGEVREAAHVKEIIDSVVVTADSGFSSEAAVLDAGIDAYIADPHFRKRDARFADQQKHKAKATDRKQTSNARKYFTASEFTFNAEGTLICPAGKPMKSSCPNWTSKGYTGRTFKGYPEHCGSCSLREQCLRSPSSPARQVTKTYRGKRHNTKSAVQRMIERFDTERGRRKVVAQWKLYRESAQHRKACPLRTVVFDRPRLRLGAGGRRRLSRRSEQRLENTSAVAGSSARRCRGQLCLVFSGFFHRLNNKLS